MVTRKDKGIGPGNELVRAGTQSQPQNPQYPHPHSQYLSCTKHSIAFINSINQTILKTVLSRVTGNSDHIVLKTETDSQFDSVPDCEKSPYNRSQHPHYYGMTIQRKMVNHKVIKPNIPKSFNFRSFQ